MSLKWIIVTRRLILKHVRARTGAGFPHRLKRDFLKDIPFWAENYGIGPSGAFNPSACFLESWDESA